MQRVTISIPEDLLKELEEKCRGSRYVFGEIFARVNRKKPSNFRS